MEGEAAGAVTIKGPFRVEVVPAPGGPGHVDTVTITGPLGVMANTLKGDSTEQQFGWWCGLMNRAWFAGGFGALREANVRRCGEVFHPLDSWSLTDWACAMAGESGEACNVVKKLRRLDSERAQATKPSHLTREDLLDCLAEELADVVIYADLLAARAGIDLREAIREKFNRVSVERGSKERL